MPILLPRRPVRQDGAGIAGEFSELAEQGSRQGTSVAVPLWAARAASILHRQYSLAALAVVVAVVSAWWEVLTGDCTMSEKTEPIKPLTQHEKFIMDFRWLYTLVSLRSALNGRTIWLCYLGTPRLLGALLFVLFTVIFSFVSNKAWWLKRRFIRTKSPVR